jgi:hypothetical protein
MSCVEQSGNNRALFVYEHVERPTGSGRVHYFRTDSAAGELTDQQDVAHDVLRPGADQEDLRTECQCLIERPCGDLGRVVDLPGRNDSVTRNDQVIIVPGLANSNAAALMTAHEQRICDFSREFQESDPNCASLHYKGPAT